MLNNVISVFGGGAVAASGAFESIATQTLTSNTTTVTFSSIPSTYKHLQLRIVGRSTRAAVSSNMYMQINSDTASNYAFHELEGSGSAASASGTATIEYIQFGRAPGTTITDTSIYGVAIVDLHDYSSTSINKTIRSLYGFDSNSTNGFVGLRSGFRNNTAAITSLSLLVTSGNWLSGSTFALYGIKGS